MREERDGLSLEGFPHRITQSMSHIMSKIVFAQPRHSVRPTFIPPVDTHGVAHASGAGLAFLQRDFDIYLSAGMSDLGRFNLLRGSGPITRPDAATGSCFTRLSISMIRIVHAVVRATGAGVKRCVLHDARRMSPRELPVRLVSENSKETFRLRSFPRPVRFRLIKQMITQGMPASTLDA